MDKTPATKKATGLNVTSFSIPGSLSKPRPTATVDRLPPPEAKTVTVDGVRKPEDYTIGTNIK